MIQITKTGGGMTHTSAFVGPTNHTLHLDIDVSTLTTNEVDVDGRLKPNVPFDKNGARITAIAVGTYVFGATVEASKIVAKNPTNATLAADTRKVTVAVATQGQINRSIARDTLGRSYTAAEIAAFEAPGSRITLTPANS